MSAFLKYFRKNSRGAVLTLVCTGIFAGVFLLYRLPPAAAVYPGMLCLTVILCSTAADFLRQRKKARVLRALQALPDSLTEDLRALGGAEEYCAIVEALTRRERENREKAERNLQNRMAYFTTWVHQIKTPIAAMELTLESMDTRQSRGLKEELMRIEQYVQMVLTYLRLDSDKTDFVFREIQLDGAVRSAIRRFAPQFIGKGLSLHYIPTDCRVVTDEKWLGFVLEQVLSNALKYTREGSVTIGTEGRRLFIRDTGIGIAPEDLPRIFQQGYTGFNGRLEHRSTGIGLYLCRQICGRLEIDITAASRLGEGTEISLTFPEKLRCTE